MKTKIAPHDRATTTDKRGTRTGLSSRFLSCLESTICSNCFRPELHSVLKGDTPFLGASPFSYNSTSVLEFNSGLDLSAKDLGSDALQLRLICSWNFLREIMQWSKSNISKVVSTLIGSINDISDN